MSSLTSLQQQMIKKIATDYLNQANGSPECADDTSTYADGIIETAQDKGVFTSLLNAGLVDHEGTGRDAYCGLTEEGWQAYLLIR